MIQTAENQIAEVNEIINGNINIDASELHILIVKCSNRK